MIVGPPTSAASEPPIALGPNDGSVTDGGSAERLREKIDPPVISVATMAQMTRSKATPIARSGQFRRIQSIPPTYTTTLEVLAERFEGRLVA